MHHEATLAWFLGALVVPLLGAGACVAPPSLQGGTVHPVTGDRRPGWARACVPVASLMLLINRV